MKRKGFVSRKSISDYNNKLCVDLKAVFEAKKNSESAEDINKLYQSLEEGFKINMKKVCEEHERNRQSYAKLLLEECIEEFKKSLNDYFRNNPNLSELLSNNTKVVINKLRHSFNSQEEVVFEAEIQTVFICHTSIMSMINHFSFT